MSEDPLLGNAIILNIKEYLYASEKNYSRCISKDSSTQHMFLEHHPRASSVLGVGDTMESRILALAGLTFRSCGEQSDIITCAQEVEMMIKQLGAQLEQLKFTVKSKTAVPTSQVFPTFIALSNLWTSFQDETVLISILSNLTAHLEPFLGTHELFFPEKVTQALLDGVTVKTDVCRMKEHIEERVDLADFRKLEWLFPETTANFDKLLIQYRGFCAYTFATTDGLLLPGNPAIGILKYKEKYYTFNTRDAAYSFAENPENYIDKVREKAKKNAELIQLLELHQQFETLIPYSQVSRVGILRIHDI
ncbi:hypothetical protein ESR_12327, partial [Eschrichtius robustus]|nr:hypothetical protein [Eschrichtius robustus]